MKIRRAWSGKRGRWWKKKGAKNRSPLSLPSPRAFSLHQLYTIPWIIIPRPRMRGRRPNGLSTQSRAQRGERKNCFSKIQNSVCLLSICFMLVKSFIDLTFCGILAVLLSLKIQLVGKKHRDKTTLASKTRFSPFQSRRFPLLVGYNI